MANNNNNIGGDEVFCDFCGRTEKQAKFLIPSPTGLFICDRCLEACNQLVAEHFGTKAYPAGGKNVGKLSLDTLPKPQDLKKNPRRLCDRAGARKKGHFCGSLQSL